MSWRNRLKTVLGPRLTTTARCLARGLPLPRWGNLRRTEPFSRQFGFERGTPIDRYYLDRFLDANRSLIRGDVLEIQYASYAKRFGTDLKRVDTLDIEALHKPTFLCDLADAGAVVPDASYDCFLLPNTLNHLSALDACLRQALRIVRPGGVILASTVGLVPLVSDVPDYWRASAQGWREIAARAWPGCAVEVESHGNCLAATAAMMGLAHEELTQQELDAHDGRYPVLITIRCTRPGAS